MTIQSEAINRARFSEAEIKSLYEAGALVGADKEGELTISPTISTIRPTLEDLDLLNGYIKIKNKSLCCDMREINDYMLNGGDNGEEIRITELGDISVIFNINTEQEHIDYVELHGEEASEEQQEEFINNAIQFINDGFIGYDDIDKNSKYSSYTEQLEVYIC